MTGAMQITPIRGIGPIRHKDKLSSLILESTELRDRDVVVVSSKAVAKAEGRIVAIDHDDTEARIRLIESEARRVLRRRGELLITETHHGFVCANSGVDFSNVPDGFAVLLPMDPDRSARKIRDRIQAGLGIEIAVVVSDTFGRSWRNGVTDVAIGCAGIRPVVDLRGTGDMFGRILKTTQVCVADQIAAAAEMVMGKADGIPAAVVSGIDPDWFGQGSIRSDVVRRYDEDMFR
jgi:coenzyme F420-0:L-glutamate ligase / coenzyme F420-1:gamma-L-glutamate ligase